MGEFISWPKAGETWVPALPWPEDECPQGLYTYGYSEALLGGKAGRAWAIYGVDASSRARPLTEAAAVRAAWEYRYGRLPFMPPPVAEGRLGSGQVHADT